MPSATLRSRASPFAACGCRRHALRGPAFHSLARGSLRLPCRHTPAACASLPFAASPPPTAPVRRSRPCHPPAVEVPPSTANPFAALHPLDTPSRQLPRRPPSPPLAPMLQGGASNSSPNRALFLDSPKWAIILKLFARSARSTAFAAPYFLTDGAISMTYPRHHQQKGVRQPFTSATAQPDAALTSGRERLCSTVAHGRHVRRIDGQ